MATGSTSASKSDKSPKRDLYSLREDERWWRDQSELLRKHGYELRPRFQPGWTPSWTIKKKDPDFCEDSYENRHPKTIDARRTSDGKRVKIKKVFKGSKETELALFLSSDELRDDPRNHCVPILDVFSEENDPLEFMVMPLLTMFERPPFSSVDEVLEFMKQTLEGLSFLHGKGVAHRDCSVLNIMMDGEQIYPKGFHPSMPLLDARGKFASPRRRRDVAGVTYYFTDFGISTRFDGTEQTRLVTGEDGQDQEVPELHKPEPYDPFPVDVFILGNLFRKEFIKVYENLGFLIPLVERMTQQDPKDRPIIDDALKQFSETVERQPPRSLRWTLIFYDGSKLERLMWNIASLKREAMVLARSYLPLLASSTMKKSH